MKLPTLCSRQAVTSSNRILATVQALQPKKIQTRQMLGHSTIPIISTKWSTSQEHSRDLQSFALKKMLQTLITSTISSTTCPSRRVLTSKWSTQTSAQSLTKLRWMKSTSLMPLPRQSRTITIRRSSPLFNSLKTRSKIQISYSSLSCQTTPTTKTSTPSWRTRSTVTVLSSLSSSPTEPSRRTMTVSSWISSDRWMLNLVEIFGECLLARKSQTKPCW